MARTRQIVKKSTFGRAPTKLLDPLPKATKPTTSKQIASRAPKIMTESDVGKLPTSLCCMCGRGDRVFETCNIVGCLNMICIEHNDSDEKSPLCASGVPENTWICPMHNKTDVRIKYDANIKVDIQSLEFSEMAWNAIMGAANSTFGGYRQGQISVYSHIFNGGNSLQQCIQDMHSKWRSDAHKWLIIKTHVNEVGDLWFERDSDGNPWSLANSTFFNALFERSEYSDINLVLLVCGTVIQPKSNNKEQILQAHTSIIDIIKRVTTGRTLLFTRHDLEPARIVQALMQSIEGYEFQHIPLVVSVTARFNSLNDDDGTPVWVLEAGQGTYVHRNVMPCSKHPQAHKHQNKFCIDIGKYEGKNYVVRIFRCNAPRIR